VENNSIALLPNLTLDGIIGKIGPSYTTGLTADLHFAASKVGWAKKAQDPNGVLPVSTTLGDEAFVCFHCGDFRLKKSRFGQHLSRPEHANLSPAWRDNAERMLKRTTDRKNRSSPESVAPSNQSQTNLSAADPRNLGLGALSTRELKSQLTHHVAEFFVRANIGGNFSDNRHFRRVIDIVFQFGQHPTLGKWDACITLLLKRTAMTK
jgi:hypothetical protein